MRCFVISPKVSRALFVKALVDYERILIVVFVRRIRDELMRYFRRFVMIPAINSSNKQLRNRGTSSRSIDLTPLPLQRAARLPHPPSIAWRV